MAQTRTELQREVAEALISTKAINLDGISSVLAKYGTRAVLGGEQLGVIIGRRVIDVCIPVDFREVLDGANLNVAAGQLKG